MMGLQSLWTQASSCTAVCVCVECGRCVCVWSAGYVCVCGEGRVWEVVCVWGGDVCVRVCGVCVCV